MKFRILLLSTLFHSAEGKYYSLSGSLNVIKVLTRRQALPRFATEAPINTYIGCFWKLDKTV